MTTSPGPRASRRSATLRRAYAELRLTSRRATEALLHQVPDTGDHATGRAVDDFVEQACDALRVLEESLSDTLRLTEQPGPSAEHDRRGTQAPQSAGQHTRLPGWWG